MNKKLPMTIVMVLSAFLMALSSLAQAKEAPIGQLSRYFGHNVDIQTDVPPTNDAISVVQLRVDAPQNIRSPGIARFTVNNQRFLEYHYAGYQDGKHTYLVAVPKAYSGSLTIGAYVDMRLAVSNTYSRTRDDLTRNTVILGANDIVLLVDVSGSMNTRVTGGTRMQLAQKVVNTIGPQLEAEGNNVAVIEYSSGNRVRIALDQKFSSIGFSAGGGTSTGSAIRAARNLLAGRDSPGKIIISITDGVPSDGSLVQSEINTINGLKNQGWAIAGIGMGMQLPSYYPIRQYTSNTASDVGLKGAILDMVKTAEEQVRDVNSVCSGDKCKAEDNDTIAPRFDVNTVSQCKTPLDGDDFEFTFLDAGEAGINLDSMSVSVDFGEVEVPMFTSIQNQADINQANASGVPPKRVILRADGNMDDITRRTLFHRANFKAEDEGGRMPYTFKMAATDLDGNSRSVTEVFNPVVDEDKKAPSIKVHAGPDNGDGEIMRNIADLSIQIDDDKTGVDPNYVNFSFTYKGEVFPFTLTPHHVGDISTDQCVARKPLSLSYTTERIIADNSMMPVLMDMLVDAFKTGDPLTFKVETEDFAKNQVVVTREVRFVPELVVKDPMRIPGIAHQFNTKTGEAGMSIDSEELAFDLDENTTYYMRLLNESDLPLNVNGKAVHSTQPVLLGTFPLEASYNVELDISSAEDGAEGQSTLVLVPNDQFSRMVHIPVNVWQPDTDLVSDNWTPVQLFEPAVAKAVQNDSVACRVTGLFEVARGADPIHDPTCFIEWIETPEDVYGTEQNFPMAVGRIPAPGEHLISYRVLFFDTDGTQFVVDSGEASFDVIPAKDVMSFSLGDRLDNTYRIVREINGELQQTSGPSCNGMTTDVDFAADRSALGNPTCLITWDNLPEGLNMGLYGSNAPNFYGPFWIPEGDAHFKWTLSSFSTSGDRIDIMQQEQVVPLLDPPNPIITVEDDQHLEDNLYWAPKLGGHVGDYVVETINAPLTIKLSREGEVIDEDVTFAGYTDRTQHRQRLLASAEDIWSVTDYEIHAYFADLPTTFAKKDVRVLSVPSEDIRPDATVNEEVILNTEDLIVDVQMIDLFNREDGYNPDDMGTWDVRLLNYLSYSNQVPVTEYKDAGSDGREQFTVDLKDIESTFLRLLPQARLHSPVESYSREVLGARPVYITLLRGEAIEASIESRRLVGEAPLNFVANLALKDRLDYEALGDIEWKIRNKGESEWKDLPEQRFPNRLYHIFDAGEYEVRAVIHNRNSGAVFTTETIEIQAFETPDVKVKGPNNAFIGDTANLTLVALLDGEEIPEDELIIQWSEDNGETWFDGGKVHSVTRDEEARMNVRVRVQMKTSPEGFEDAVEEEGHRLSFEPIRPPRVGIYGPGVIESFKPVEWVAMAREPYPNMDVVIKGEFILPDGTIVPESEVEYMATQEDADKERIEVQYRSWIEGFRDKGAVTVDSRPVNVWEYEWPAWQFYTWMSATQAPADVQIRLRSPSGSVRYLEDLTFQWKVPAGVKVVESDREDSRVLRIEEPGTYPIEVTVSDGRGYVSELVHELEISEQDPWLVGFRLSKSNDLDRAPLELRFIPDVSGGHPRDRLRLHRYYLNGQMISEGERYASADLAAGTYELGLEIETEFGKVVRYTEELEVLPNLIPECQLEASQAGVSWRFKAECTDEDGYITKHKWVVDGEELALSGSRISVSVRETGQLDVSVKAIDNGGAESDLEIWSGVAQAPEPTRRERDREKDREESKPEDQPGNSGSDQDQGPQLPNEPPVCSMDQRKWGQGMRFSVDCEDPDGRVVDYKWKVNGQAMGESDTRLVVNSDPGVEVTVEFKGVDDRGDASATQSWKGVVNPEPEDKGTGKDKGKDKEKGKPEEKSDPVAENPDGNVLPVCDLRDRRSGSGHRFQARCDDEDGYVINNIWTVNGQVVDTSDSRLNVEVKSEQNVVVTHQGVDDGGAKSAIKKWEGVIKP